MRIRWAFPHWLACTWSPWSSPITETWEHDVTEFNMLIRVAKYTAIAQTRSCLICNRVEQRRVRERCA